MTEHTTFTNLGGPIADRDELREAIRRLRLPATVRERCANIAAAVKAGESSHFVLDRSKLPEVARRVARLTRQRYPGIIPPHSRWRHFETGGIDRKATLDLRIAGLDRADQARTRIDLAVVSVLLDAGAGSEWAYQEHASGRRFARSEGLAVATFQAFVEGRFSSDRRTPLRVDAAALERIDDAQLAEIFQVGEGNPLVGLDGRAALLRRLGAALRARPDVFSAAGRPGYLFDLLSIASVGEGASRRQVPLARVSAPGILRTLLKAFGGIWPSGQTLQGRAVGDTWAHPKAGGQGVDAGRVPFHKLSQWLAYSLIEPFEWAGLQVDRVDELTGLPEYRNGGLFIDTGVVVPRNPDYGRHVYTPADPWVVEWRALTVTLLDEVARMVRTELNEPKLSLAAVLEGGTWAAGREVAAERRPGGPAPVRVASNGTIF